MSERDRAMSIAMVAEAFGVKPEKLTAARIRIYEKALQKVPVPVLEPMAQRIIETRRPSWGDLPPVTHWLEDAEACRREIMRSIKHEPCALCEDTGNPGYQEIVIDGVKRLKRCQCWTIYARKVAALGVGTQPLSLPEARPYAEGDEA